MTNGIFNLKNSVINSISFGSIAFLSVNRMDSSGLGAGPQDAEGLPSWLQRPNLAGRESIRPTKE